MVGSENCKMPLLSQLLVRVHLRTHYLIYLPTYSSLSDLPMSGVCESSKTMALVLRIVCGCWTRHFRQIYEVQIFNAKMTHKVSECVNMKHNLIYTLPGLTHSKTSLITTLFGLPGHIKFAALPKFMGENGGFMITISIMLNWCHNLTCILQLVLMAAFNYLDFSETKRRYNENLKSRATYREKILELYYCRSLHLFQFICRIIYTICQLHILKFKENVTKHSIWMLN